MSNSGKKVPNLKCLNCIDSYYGSVISTLSRDLPAHCLSSSGTQQTQETSQQQKPQLSPQVQLVPGLQNLLWARTETQRTSHSEGTAPETADAAGTLTAY